MEQESPPQIKKRYQYTQEELCEAIQAVDQGQSINQVATEMGIPYSTLRKKCLSDDQSKFSVKYFFFIC